MHRYGHLRGVSSKSRDVLLDPLEGKPLIEESDVWVEGRVDRTIGRGKVPEKTELK
jgi:hypothetical protein